MKRFLSVVAGLLAVNTARAQIPAYAAAPRVTPAKGEQVAVLAGGCFWGGGAGVKHVEGGNSRVSRFSGGGAGGARYPVLSTCATGGGAAVEGSDEAAPV